MDKKQTQPQRGRANQDTRRPIPNHSHEEKKVVKRQQVPKIPNYGQMKAAQEVIQPKTPMPVPQKPQASVEPQRKFVAHKKTQHSTHPKKQYSSVKSSYSNQSHEPHIARHKVQPRKITAPVQTADNMTFFEDVSKKPAHTKQKAVGKVFNLFKNKNNGKSLRIIPLGGQEEVGRNMTVFEYGDDIVILDMGMQFPEEDMPGIDYIVPDISYLKGKEKNIRGVIFSHGHLDHIGAASILLKQLGYPLIIGMEFTIASIKHKLEDQEAGSSKRLNIALVKDLNKKIQLGAFEIGFFAVEHSIVDSMGTLLTTPEGTIMHLGDWTLERDDNGNRMTSYEQLSKIPGPTILMLESLGALDYSVPTPGPEMYRNLKKLIDDAPSKVIVGTFSSQIKRVGQLIEHSEKVGKKVALDGYSMKMNVKIAQELGYLKVHKNTIIDIKDIHKYPDNKIVIICTGAQGESNAVLSRIIEDKHRFVKINKDDTIIFSSSVIPGNERTIQRLKDNLYRKSENVIHTGIMDVHTSGHCNADDIKEVIKQIKPTYYLPVYANHYFLKESAKLAMETGFKKENIFVLDNGSVFESKNKKVAVLDKKVKTDYVFIDGLGVGDIGEIVMKDRQVMGQDGMFTIVVTVNRKTGEILQSPDIISRGFIYMKESRELVEQARKKVKDIVNNGTKEQPINWNNVRNDLRDKMGDFLYQKTERRPMILPVIIEN